MCTEYYKVNDYFFCEVNNLLMITTFVHTTNRQGDVTYAYERSQNTVLLASTQAVYKAPHSTVREQ